MALCKFSKSWLFWVVIMHKGLLAEKYAKPISLKTNDNILVEYHIAGKFGGENVWWIHSFQAFGGKKFGEWIDQPNSY